MCIYITLSASLKPFGSGSDDKVGNGSEHVSFCLLPLDIQVPFFGNSKRNWVTITLYPRIWWFRGFYLGQRNMPGRNRISKIRQLKRKWPLPCSWLASHWIRSQPREGQNSPFLWCFCIGEFPVLRLLRLWRHCDHLNILNEIDSQK